MTLNAYDDLTICNNALDLLGSRLVSSIAAPKTDKEASVARLYRVTIGSLLSRHDWNFANPVRELAVNADLAPVGGYKYAYKLPSDLIAGPFAVYTAADLDRPIQGYNNVNDHIHTDETSCFVRYRVFPREEIWPVYFTDLAIVALASRFAKPIANNEQLATEYRIQAYGDARMGGNGGLFGSAKSIDSTSQPVKSLFRTGDPLTSLVY